MGYFQFSKKMSLLIFLLHLNFISSCLGARKLTSLYQPSPIAMTYHKGALLEGNLPVSILWYGEFSPAQKSIIADFLLSLNPQKNQLGSHFTTPQPSVSKRWHTIQTYMKKAGKGQTRVFIASQFSDKNCSLGKIFKKAQVFDLANQKLNSKYHVG